MKCNLEVKRPVRLVATFGLAAVLHFQVALADGAGGEPPGETTMVVNPARTEATAAWPRLVPHL